VHLEISRSPIDSNPKNVSPEQGAMHCLLTIVLSGEEGDMTISTSPDQAGHKNQRIFNESGKVTVHS